MAFAYKPRQRGTKAYDFERCDEPYISDAYDMNLEKQSKMTLQDNEPLQHDNNEMHTLKNQLKVSEDMVEASLVRYDSTHKVVEDLYRKTQREVDEDCGLLLICRWSKQPLNLLKFKSDYLCLLSDRDYTL